MQSSKSTNRLGRLKLAAMLFVAASVYPIEAMAQETVGSRLWSILDETWAPFFILITGICYTAAIFLFGSGLMKLRLAADNGHGNPMMDGILKLVAASLLIGIPSFAGIGVETWTGSASSFFGSSSAMGDVARQLDLESGSVNVGAAKEILGNIKTPNGTENCYRSGDPVVCMAKNVANNVVPIGSFFVFALTCILGFAVFANGIGEMSRFQSSNRGIPQGWASKMALSVLMMNSPFLFAITTTSLMGTTDIMDASGWINSSSNLLSYSYNGGASGKANEYLSKYEDLIHYCFHIMVFFGVWSFCRGLFQFKAAAEGNNRASYGMAAVYLVAGVALANAKLTTCTVMFSTGGSGMTLGFCN